MSNNTSPSYNFEDDRENGYRDNKPSLLSGLLLDDKNTNIEDPEYYRTLNKLIEENSHKSVWEVCKEYENKIKNQLLNKNKEPQFDTQQKDLLSPSKTSSKKDKDDDEDDDITISVMKDDEKSIIYSDSDFIESDRFIQNSYKDDVQENLILNNNNNISETSLHIDENKNELEQLEEFNLRNRIDIDEVYSKTSNHNKDYNNYNNFNDFNINNKFQNKINEKSDRQSLNIINLVDTESFNYPSNAYPDNCKESIIPFTKKVKVTACSVNTNPSIISITTSQKILNEANNLKSFQSPIKNPPKNIIEKEVFYKDEYLPDIESETLEYKNYRLPIHISGIKCIMKTANAFLNTKGGRIYLGVNNFRQVKGIAANSAEIDDLCNVLINLTEDFNPSCRLKLVQTKYFPVMNSWNDTVIKDMYVVVLIVSPGDKFTLYSVNSNCYVSYLRVNSQNIYLKASDIESEFKNRNKDFWEIKNKDKEANNEQEKLLGKNIEIQSFQSYNSECIGSIKNDSNLRNNKEIASPINNNIKLASPLNTNIPLVESKDITSNINSCYSPTIPLTKTNNNGIKDYENNSISIILPLSNELEDKLQMEKAKKRKNKAPAKKPAQESNKKCAKKSKKTNNKNTENQVKPKSNIQDESQDRINRIKRQMRLNRTKSIFLENKTTNEPCDSKDKIVRNSYSNSSNRNRNFSDQICGSPINKFDKLRNNKKNAKIINYDNKNIDENMNYHDVFKLCGNNIEEHSKSQVLNEDITSNKDDTVIGENLTEQTQNNHQMLNKMNDLNKPNDFPQFFNSQEKRKNDIESPHIVLNKGRNYDLDIKPTTNIFHIEEIYGNSNKQEYKPVTSNLSKKRRKNKEIEDPNDPYIIKNLALINEKKEEKVKRPRKLYDTNNFSINKSNLRKRQSKKNEFTFNFLNKKKAKEVPVINANKAQTYNNFNSYYSNNINSLIAKAQKTNKKQANKKFDMISLIEENEEEERSLENNPYIQISFDDQIYGDTKQDKKNDKKKFEKQTQKKYSYKSLFLKKNNTIKNINNTSMDQIDVIDNIIFNSSGSSGSKNSCCDFFIDLGIDNSK